MVLYPKRTTIVLYGLLCLLFVAGNLALIFSGQTDGMGSFQRGAIYFGIPFFGLGVVVFVVQLMPGSTFLRLEDDSFTFSSLYRQQTFRWADIEEFFIVQVPARKLVAWNFVPAAKPVGAGRKLSQGLTGCDAALPDTYGTSAEALTLLMNQYRDTGRAS